MQHNRCYLVGLCELADINIKAYKKRTFSLESECSIDFLIARAGEKVPSSLTMCPRRFYFHYYYYGLLQPVIIRLLCEAIKILLC